MSRKTCANTGDIESDLLEQLQGVLAWVIDDRSLPPDRPHGNAEWTPLLLATTAVVWAWQSLGTLTSRFDEARTITAKLNPDKTVPATYQSFVKALAVDSAALVNCLVVTLRKRMRQVAGTHWKVGRWCVFAFDGTRLQAPRTADNQTWFDQPMSVTGKKKRSRKKRSQRSDRGRPQAWLTVCWHLGSELPDGSLVTADAGFVGYDLLRQVTESGHELLVRVGSNVRLLKSSGYIKRRKGHGGAELVLLWPDKMVRKKQPPLVLRIIRVRDGRQPMALVTSVLMERDLSDKQALEIYRRRWGIEVFMRTFPCCDLEAETFEKGQLLSGAPANAERELAWSYVALWSVQLLGAKGLIAEGLDPCELSSAQAIHALQRTLIVLSSKPVNLLAAMAQPHNDGYERADKSSRDFPRKKKGKPPGLPQLHPLKDIHHAALREIQL